LRLAEGGGSVLDYGCGEGAYGALHLAEHGKQVTAIDLSPVAIEHARDTARAKGVDELIDFRVMNAEQLDFPDASFDVVAGNGVIHHLDLDRSLAEVARVLKPGGSAIFLEPMGHNPLINLYRRRTPEQRTEDEHPLKTKDFDVLKRHFDAVDARYFHLLSLAALPFVARRGLVKRLDSVDRKLFQVVPATQRLAWIVVVRLRGPRTA
jgi:SAM-dependent methyltransferase